MNRSRSNPRGTRPLGVVLTLALGLVGCGGKGTETGDATVVADPTSKPSATSSSTSTPTVASTTPTSTSGSSSAPAAVTPVKAEGWGTLKGQVKFGGDAPAAKVLVAQGDPNAKDAAVCAKAEVKAERLVVDPASKGVKFAIVYIPKPTAVNPEAKSEKSSASVLFDQKNCVFEPHVLAVMTNAKIDLKSSDPVSHNINCKVQNNGFNEAVAPNGEIIKTPVAAARLPGLVTCDIHPWMTAYWLVLDNPYFAVTDEKGNFEIKNAPAGTQKVVVWQEAANFVTPSSGQDVTIAANGSTAQEFTIDPAKVKPAN